MSVPLKRTQEIIDAILAGGSPEIDESAHAEDPKKCNNCCNNSGNACASLKGGKHNDFVVLGESPSPAELGSGVPFSGKYETGEEQNEDTGKFVTRIFCEEGIDIKECFLINAINCDVNHPWWSKCSERKHALAGYSCVNRVYHEIFSRPRKLILAFGGINFKLHAEDTSRGITESTGTIGYFRHPSGCCPLIKIFFSIHPSAFLNHGAGDEAKEKCLVCMKQAIAEYKKLKS